VWLGVLLAVGGLFMLFYHLEEGFSIGIGDALLFMCAVFFAAHIVCLDAFTKQIDHIYLSMVQLFSCSVFNLIFAFIFDDFSLEAIYNAKWSILYCGIMSSGVAYTLQVVSQKNLEATLAAIVASTESVFSAIGGVIFGLDHIAPIGYIGCVIIFIGITISQVNIDFIFKKIKRYKK
jgi:drug/metabolite transporter (DMT)-like permease